MIYVLLYFVIGCLFAIYWFIKEHFYLKVLKMSGCIWHIISWMALGVLLWPIILACRIYYTIRAKII